MHRIGLLCALVLVHATYGAAFTDQGRRAGWLAGWLAGCRARRRATSNLAHTRAPPEPLKTAESPGMPETPSPLAYTAPCTTPWYTRGERNTRCPKQTPSDTIIVFGADGSVGAECVAQLNAAGIDTIGQIPHMDSTRGMCATGTNGTLGTPSEFAQSWTGVSSVTYHSGRARARYLFGSVYSLADVQACFSAADSPIRGVVVAIDEPGRIGGHTKPCVGTRNVVDCMRAAGVGRVVAVTCVQTRHWQDQEGIFASLYGTGAGMKWCVLRPPVPTVGLHPQPSARQNGATITSSREMAKFCIDYLHNEVFARQVVCLDRLQQE